MELYANPFDTSVSGFFFTCFEEFCDKVEASGAEEFEIDVIDGDDEDIELAKACGVCQGNLADFFELMDRLEDLDDHRRAAFFWMTDTGSFSPVDAIEKVEDACVRQGSAEDWAYDIVEECYDLPEPLASYFDYRAFARDAELNGDIDSFRFAGQEWVIEPNSF